MNPRFWRKKKPVYFSTPAPKLELRGSGNHLNLDELSREEFDYLVKKFTETIKSLVYMTIEDRIRDILKKYTNILGGDSVTITHTWGILGNDLIVWLGEFRRNQKAKELRS